MESGISTRIKSLRIQLGLNQGEFSKPLGIDRSHIAGIENCSRNPSGPLLRLISHVYCVYFTWLTTGKGEIFISPEESIKRQVRQFGEFPIVQAITNIMAGYDQPKNEGVQTISSEKLSDQVLSIEIYFNNLVERFGEHAFINATDKYVQRMGRILRPAIDDSGAINNSGDESNKSISLEKALKIQIARFGERAVIDTFISLMKENGLAVADGHHVPHTDTDNPEIVSHGKTFSRRIYDKDPELKRMIDTLYTIWLSDDDRLKSWASVQFDRAFPDDIIEGAQKKQKETHDEPQIS